MRTKFNLTVKKYLPPVLAGAILLGFGWGVLYGTAVAAMCLVLTLTGWM